MLIANIGLKQTPQILNTIRINVLLLLVVFLPIVLQAQQPIFKNYSVKDGLPSSETYFSLQDSKGFIWVASDAGVARFDGNSFRTFSIENGLADNTIFGISEDRHGRIWFRSLSGRISYFDNDSIYTIGANDSIAANIKNSLMISFYVDSGDTLWCGIRAGTGYYKIYPGYKASDFHRITPVNTTLFLVKIEGDNYIYGNILSSKLPTCLSVYNKSKLLGSPPLDGLDATNIHYLPNGNDLFLTTDIKQIQEFKLTTAAKLLVYDVKDNAMITCFSKDGSNIWLSKRAEGVYNYIYKNQRLIQGSLHYLNGNSVTNIMTDNEGGKWFTTLENGIYYLSPSHFIREYSLPPGPSSVKYLISKIDQYHISISKAKDTFDIASADTIIKSCVFSVKKGIQAILKDTSFQLPLIINTGNLYSFKGTASYGIFKKNHSAQLFLNRVGGPLACYLTATDSINDCIYVTDRYNLYRMYDNSSVTELLDTLLSRTLSCMVDNKGVLWLGCLNGLWKREGDKLKYCGNEYQYLKRRITGISQDRKGAYYFATYGNGLVIESEGKFTRLTSANGLISDNCESVFTDSYGTVWVGARSGVSSIIYDDRDGYIITKYNLADAFPNQAITQIMQTGNKLWLSSQNGIISHSLPAVEAQPVPSVFITQFLVNDIKYSIDKSASLSYNENRVKISFVGISYNSFGKIEYKYKLLGLDTIWHNTQTPNVQYQFLPPGSYDFSVKAIAANGKESRNDIHIRFTIAKPFWQTWWFIVLMILVVASVLYVWLRIVEAREHEKTIMNKRIADIEMKALRAQMNPHFIFNAINSIQKHILKNDSKTAQDYLAKFARLIRNVLENSKMEFIPLGQEMDTLTLYMSLEQLRAGGKFKFAVTIAPEISVYKTMIPPLLLQPFVENSILHGLMPLSDTSGLLTINIYEKDNRLICIIEDNGIGRKKASEVKKNRDPMHRSMGMSATEDRINILNDFNPGFAGVKIEDIEGERTGTRVIVTIPLRLEQA